MNTGPNNAQKTKTCTNCGETKPLSDFQYIKTQRRFVSQCKACINAKRVARARSHGRPPKKHVTNLLKGTKICSGCKQEKRLEDFYVSNGHYNYLCKECSRKKDTNKRRASGIKSKEEQRLEWEQKGEKPCIKCGNIKPLNDFKINNKTNRKKNVCTECEKNYYKEYREKNSNHKKETWMKWYEKNKDEIINYQKKYRESHKEQIRTRAKKYASQNTDKIRAQKAQYYKDNKEQLRQKNREYYRQNSEMLKEYQRQYAQKNVEKIFERRKAYRERNADILKERKKEYGKRNRQTITASWLSRRRNDPLFKLSTQARNLIRMSLSGRGYTKDTHTYEILGCDYETLWEHLKNTWLDNYGTEWNGEEYHIDHIVPLATAKTEQEIKDLCYYKNLQLLKPHDNLVKNKNLNWQLKKPE